MEDVSVHKRTRYRFDQFPSVCGIVSVANVNTKDEKRSLQGTSKQQRASRVSKIARPAAINTFRLVLSAMNVRYLSQPSKTASLHTSLSVLYRYHQHQLLMQLQQPFIRDVIYLLVRNHNVNSLYNDDKCNQHLAAVTSLFHDKST